MISLQVLAEQQDVLIVSDYTIFLKQILGQGQQGVVVNCRKNSTKEDICCKVMKKDAHGRHLSEVNIFKNLCSAIQNINLVRVYDVIDDPSYLECLLFMEKCDTDLQKDMKWRELNNSFYTCDEVRVIIKSIVAGYSILRNKSIIHRDLKPENILIKKGIFKISDFGVGKITNQTITNAGTPLFQAPEVITPIAGKPYTNSCDIYSLGILAYKLVYLCQHFMGIKEYPQLIQFHKTLKTTKFKCEPTQAKQFNKSPEESTQLMALFNLIEQMIVYDPNQRITWDQLEQHQWINQQQQQQQPAKTPIKILQVQTISQQYQQQPNFPIRYISGSTNSNIIPNPFPPQQPNDKLIVYLHQVYELLVKTNEYVNGLYWEPKVLHDILSYAITYSMYLIKHYMVELLKRGETILINNTHYRIINIQSANQYVQSNHIDLSEQHIQYHEQTIIQQSILLKNYSQNPQLCNDAHYNLVRQLIKGGDLFDYLNVFSQAYNSNWRQQLLALKDYFLIVYIMDKVCNLQVEYPINNYERMDLNKINQIVGDNEMKQYIAMRR